MPREDIIYFGDSLHNPYGTKTKEEVTERCIEICDEFIQKGAKAIVIACNTATSACVPLLRERYSIDIIGMEPALKVASELGNHQNIAVWATELTLKEKKFADLMKKFADDHEIYKIPCPKLVEIVENDQLNDTSLVVDTLQTYLQNLDLDKLNSIVLGCTHFVFYKKILSSLLNGDINIIDGNLGTAMHLQDILNKKGLINHFGGHILWENSLPDKIELSKRLYKRLEDEHNG